MKFLPAAIITIFSIWYWQSLPEPLFDQPLSTVIEDSDSQLLGARISADGQWRFPPSQEVAEKFKQCLIEYEDRQFYRHPGFNPLSLIRALINNIKAGSVRQGGSTLSMQVIRLAGKRNKRNLAIKLREIILSTRLELGYSKEEILAFYASNAPFGGNVVGLDAASWRYFSRPPSLLSWSESATLAVLPNAPSLVHPGKNRDILRAKRDKLLTRLLENGTIDSLTCELSVAEDIPEEPLPLPSDAPHLLDRLHKLHPGERLHTCINRSLQQRVNDIIRSHYKVLSANEVHNIAALVVEVSTGKVIAYAGNVLGRDPREHGAYVNIIQAPRSTGSIMKPFLYAIMLNSGELLPSTLVPDIPTVISGYSPKNFNFTYEGAVPAGRALSHSLNIPAVRMLQDFGVPRFYSFLKLAGLTSLKQEPGHYGLSLILGGAEASLWELAGIYSSMSRVLVNYEQYPGTYDPSDYHMPVILADDSLNYGASYRGRASNPNGLLSAASIWLTWEALLDVNRPREESGWEFFDTRDKIAWKTGTSFGFRDAWSIGTTPRYVVAVWTGNADGEGRPGLTGGTAAAPVMFDIFGQLDLGRWFRIPVSGLTEAAVCNQSGYRAGKDCDNPDTILIPESGLKSKPCPYHKKIFVDESGKYRVGKDCSGNFVMKEARWFILPPVQEYYFKKKNPFYRPLPPLRKGCPENREIKAMEFIYPDKPCRLFLPRELDGSQGKIVFRIAHREHNSTLYWHLDENFIGTTTNQHQFALSPAPGKHQLLAIDNDGNSCSIQFVIIND